MCSVFLSIKIITTDKTRVDKICFFLRELRASGRNKPLLIVESTLLNSQKQCSMMSNFFGKEDNLRIGTEPPRFHLLRAVSSSPDFLSFHASCSDDSAAQFASYLNTSILLSQAQLKDLQPSLRVNLFNESKNETILDSSLTAMLPMRAETSSCLSSSDFAQGGGERMFGEQGGCDQSSRGAFSVSGQQITSLPALKPRKRSDRIKGKIYIVKGARKRWDGNRFTRCCILLNCTKLAQGRTYFCKSHGGGRRCAFDGCVNAARGGHSVCAKHGAKRSKRDKADREIDIASL